MEKIEYKNREYVLKAGINESCKGCSFAESDSDCKAVLKINLICITKNTVWQPLIWTSGSVLKEDETN
jgi:hypothetical protein